MVGEPKFEGKKFELAIATTDAHEELSNMASNFIYFSSDFPEESRKIVAEWTTLTPLELQQVTEDLEKLFDAAEETRGKIPDSEKTAYLKREVGNRIFHKYWSGMLGATLFGEMPGLEPNADTDASELRIRKAADTLTTYLRELLVPNIYSELDE